MRLIEDRECGAQGETVKECRVALRRSCCLVEAEHDDAIRDAVDIGGGITPHAQDGDLAVSESAPSALEFQSCLFQEFPAPSQPDHDAWLALSQVIADQIHAGAGLPYTGRKVEHRPPLPGVQQTAHLAGREPLMREQCVVRHAETTEGRGGFRGSVDNEAEESKKGPALIGRPGQRGKKGVRLAGIFAPEPIGEFGLLRLGQQSQEQRALLGVTHQPLGGDGGGRDSTEDYLGLFSHVQQLKQLAGVVAEQAPHIGEGCGSEDALKGEARRLDHRDLRPTRRARTPCALSTRNPSPLYSSMHISRHIRAAARDQTLDPAADSRESRGRIRHTVL